MTSPAPILNPATLITASRFLFWPLYYWAIANHHVAVAVITVTVSALIDLLDGLVARRLGCSTAFGEVFDAVTDTLSHAFFWIVLVAFGRLPWSAGAVVAGLILTTTALRVMYGIRAGRTTNFRSYASERLVAFAAFVTPLGAAGIEPAFYSWSFVALLAITVVHDAKRMVWDPIPAATSTTGTTE